jgi:hypothetical protein
MTMRAVAPTLPPFHEIPKVDLRTAYFWEVDRQLWAEREMWRDWGAAERDCWEAWPELSEQDKARARERVGLPVLCDEVPPAPARAGIIRDVEEFLDRVEAAYPKPWEKPFFYVSAPHPLNCLHRDGTVELPVNALDEKPCFQDNLGLRFLPLVIRPTATKREILESVSKELDRLMPSVAKNKRTRGPSYESRFYSLLAQRLKWEGRTVAEARRLIMPCQKAWGCGELTERRWSDLRLESKRDMEARWKKMWEYCCLCDEEDTARNGSESVWYRNEGRRHFLWPVYLNIGNRDKTPVPGMHPLSAGLLQKTQEART